MPITDMSEWVCFCPICTEAGFYEEDFIEEDEEVEFYQEFEAVDEEFWTWEMDEV